MQYQWFCIAKLWHLFTDTVVIFYPRISSAQVRNHSAIIQCYIEKILFLQNVRNMLCSFAGNVMTLKFLSDASITAGGFQLEYTAMDASSFPKNYTHYFNWGLMVKRTNAVLMCNFNFIGKEMCCHKLLILFNKKKKYYHYCWSLWNNSLSLQHT